MLFRPQMRMNWNNSELKFLGTKGIIKDIFDEFKAVSPEEKRTLGKVLNEFKQLAEAKYQALKESSAEEAGGKQCRA